MYKNAPCTKLSSLGNQIQQTENAGSIMNGSLERTSIEYKRIKNQFAPISSLPDELVSIIFEAGCVRPSPDPPEIPFEILVSQVSHHWRNIALTTSRLWANIILGNSVDMVNLYFQRSKKAALLLTIHININRHTLEDIASLGHLVALHTRRLHCMAVVCDWCKGLDVFFDCLPSAAPFLQRLTIDYVGGPRTEFRRVFADGAPCLTAFVFGSMMPLNCIPPLANVTHLGISEHPLSNPIFRLLLTGPCALTHLVINDSFIDFTAIEIIDLPSLRSLHLTDSSGYNIIPGLLSIVLAPSLEYLTLETLVPTEVESIADAIVPKYPSLRFLTINTCLDKSIFLPHTWLLLMGAFPTVTHFTLLHDDFRHFLETFDEQTYLPESVDMSPSWLQLHTLTLIGHLSDPSVPLIRSALSARIASGHPIRKLQLSNPITSIPIDDLQWLQTNAELEECTIPPESICGSSIITWWDGFH